MRLRASRPAAFHGHALTFGLAFAFAAGSCAQEPTAEPFARGSSSSSGGRGAEDGGPSTNEAGAAQSPPPEPVPGLHAEYFDGYHEATVQRVEPLLDHDWGSGAPVPGVGKDRFSARWTGTLTPVISARTKLVLDADDGVRLWIDDKLVIDDWRAHFVERHTADVELTKGKPVAIRVDYFEADLDASVRLSWSAGTALPEQVVPSDRFMTTGVPSGLRAPKPPFANPVIAFNCADPGVIGEGGMFYSACTGGALSIRASRDLVTWTDVPGASILPLGKPGWAANGDRNWAPEFHRAGQKFLAYYTSVNASDVLSIGVATATSMNGPWTDKGSPLVQHPDGVIDATFFEDDDGSRWLFYKIDGNAKGKATPIFVRRLAPDGLSFAVGSTQVQVLTNDSATWEGGVIEAPWVVKRDGRYFMFYSGNVYDAHYRTGVARATSLTGPWEKKGAPVLTNNDAWVGPGHGSVVRAADLDYFVYHAWRNDGAGGGAPEGRLMLVDRITWANGWPSIGNGSPTVGAQPWPGEPF